jgi:hypothetical protein
MNKEAKSRLDGLMDKYEQRLAETKTKQEQIKSEEETFLSEFKRLREEVIRTTMEEVGIHLKHVGTTIRYPRQRNQWMRKVGLKMQR